MLKEIGSYQSNIVKQKEDNQFFSNDLNWFISGRAALDFIIKDIKCEHDVKTAALPSWCCDSMIAPFIKNNIDVIFYHVSLNKDGVIKDLNVKADVLLFVDYFGFEHTNKLDFDGIIINDITQSVFSNNNQLGDYQFCSLRKWAGFVTGAFAKSKKGFIDIDLLDVDQEYVSIRKEAIKEKEDYLANRTDKKDYYQKFVDSEDSLDYLYGCEGLKSDIEEAKYWNINDLISRRRKNVEILLSYLKEYAIFKELKENDCPLYLPILVKDKERLRKYLNEKNIYCPTHWYLTDLHTIDDKDKCIYDNELSIICDQRYGDNEMHLVGKTIKEYLDKEEQC